MSFVTAGAMLACSFGLAPCPLVVLPARTVLLCGRPKANIMDFVPFTNIPTFGMCTAPTNPLVIAETAAAMGVPTPAPCTPAIVSPWMPGYPPVLVQNFPALTSESRTMCMWLGQISITNDGQIPLPPPVCTAPPGKPIVPIPIRMPLTSADFSAAGGGGDGGGGGGGSSSSANEEMRKKYEKDVKKAEDAGKQQEMMSKSCDKAAKESAQAGQPEKAAQAQKMSETAMSTATDQKNNAVGDVNQLYRETMPPPKAQMDKLTPAQQQEYSQQRESISQQKEQTCQQAESDYQSSTKDMMATTTRDLQIHFAEVEEQKALKQLNLDTIKKSQE